MNPYNKNGSSDSLSAHEQGLRSLDRYVAKQIRREESENRALALGMTPQPDFSRLLDSAVPFDGDFDLGRHGISLSRDGRGLL